MYKDIYENMPLTGSLPRSLSSMSSFISLNHWSIFLYGNTPSSSMSKVFIKLAVSSGGINTPRSLRNFGKSSFSMYPNRILGSYFMYLDLKMFSAASETFVVRTDSLTRAPIEEPKSSYIETDKRCNVKKFKKCKSV